MEVDIMAIGAHPDDIEIGMGGTIAAFTNAGYKVVLLDLSDGEPTPHGTHEKRMKECHKSAKILKVEKRITLDLVNREIMDSIETRKKVATVIRQYKPKLLFIPYWDDGHPDHLEACKLCQAARFYAKLTKTDMPYEPYYPKKIFHYLTLHMRLKTEPSFIFNISEFMETKIKALNSYVSQFVANQKNVHVFESVKLENAYWGKQIRQSYGEPFVCKEHIQLYTPESILNA